MITVNPATLTVERPKENTPPVLRSNDVSDRDRITRMEIEVAKWFALLEARVSQIEVIDAQSYRRMKERIEALEARMNAASKVVFAGSTEANVKPNGDIGDEVEQEKQLADALLLLNTALENNDRLKDQLAATEVGRTDSDRAHDDLVLKLDDANKDIVTLLETIQELERKVKSQDHQMVYMDVARKDLEMRLEWACYQKGYSTNAEFFSDLSRALSVIRC